jgi:DNA (cytosine-5)-methyltransferase 1
VNELSLFSGAGGGLLGSKLLGWRCIGYVEWEEYCQRVLRQRIEDGCLDNAPIFGDIRAFNAEYAGSYRGLVDVVTGGFPCQPFSCAGKRLGEDDPRNMWPATIECIRLVRPKYALLENVPALLNSGYFSRILGDLAEAGYDARWAIISAQSQGAPCKRERLFLACTNSEHGQARMGAVEDWQKQVWERNERKCPEFWLQAPPDACGMGHGVADWMDRLKAIGNGQVPAVVRAAWGLLGEGGGHG